MKSSKVFVSPSTREGFGMSVLDALSCGLPAIVVKHKQNASVELIEDEKNGFVCGLDKDIIAEKINELLNNKDKLKQMSKYAKESIIEYSWDNITKDVEELYKEVIKW